MKKAPAWLILCIITLVAGTALGVTNALTEGPIARQAEEAAAAARRTVMAEAGDFEEIAVAEGTEVGEATILSCHKAVDASGSEIGTVVTAAVKGYGGTIEVTVGIAADGSITGIACGGSGFNETAGLGAKVKDAGFTAQFAGKAAPVQLVKFGGDVDSVTQASISSNAVCQAVNAAAEFAGK